MVQCTPILTKSLLKYAIMAATVDSCVSLALVNEWNNAIVYRLNTNSDEIAQKLKKSKVIKFSAAYHWLFVLFGDVNHQQLYRVAQRRQSQTSRHTGSLHSARPRPSLPWLRPITRSQRAQFILRNKVTRGEIRWKQVRRVKAGLDRQEWQSDY